MAFLLAFVHCIYAMGRVEHLEDTLQPPMLILVPLAMTLACAIRFPSGIPARDCPCAMVFFPFVAIFALIKCAGMWESFGLMSTTVRDVRRWTVVISTAAISAHAFVVVPNAF